METLNNAEATTQEASDSSSSAIERIREHANAVAGKSKPGVLEISLTVSEDIVTATAAVAVAATIGYFAYKIYNSYKNE